MKIEVFENEEKLEFENVFITKYEEILDKQKLEKKELILDFSAIQLLKGEKTILEMSFQDEKKESLI